MTLVFGADNQVGAWIAQRLGMDIHPPFVAIGIIDDAGNAKGGFLYNYFNGSNLEISYYGPSTVTRSVLRAAFWAYPFEQVGAKRLTASTKRSNELVQRLLPRVGFVKEAELKNYYGENDDAIVYRLDRETAERWKKRSPHG